MYGGDQWNPHLLLRYGYTLDFFKSFSPLRFHGIELPLPLIRPYHQYIRRFVDQQLDRDAYLHMKNKQWKLHSMSDVQAQLQRMPRHLNRLCEDSGRDMILLCGNYADFAIKHLAPYKVILLSHYLYERKYLKNRTIPKQFQVYRLGEKLLFGRVPRRVLRKQKELTTSFDHIYYALRKQASPHPIFAKPLFRHWMYEQISLMTALIDELNIILMSRPIKLIVEHTDILPRQSILALLARIHGLPFLHIQHHLSSDASIIPTRASHYAVWGKHMSDWLVQRGIERAAISVVGSVRLELSEKPIVLTREHLSQELGWDKEHPIITFTTQQYGDRVNHQVMEWIMEAVHSLPVWVLIKPHPDDPLTYEPYMSEQLRKIPAGFQLHEVLQASELILTISSSTAVESAMYGKGVIILQPEMPYDYHLNYNGYASHLVKADAGFVADSAQALKQYLRRWLEDQDVRRELVERGKAFKNLTLTPSQTAPGVEVERLIRQLLQR